MPTLHRSTLTTLLLLAASLPLAAPAGEALEQIHATTDRILAIVQDPALQGPDKAVERDRRVRVVIGERFDWEAMSRSAMGSHWQGLSDAQRREFVDLFRQLVEKNYLSEVEDYSGEKILYKGDKAEGTYGVVNVVIVTLRGTDVPVSYRVLRKDAGWFVYDLSIEGVSMVNNYRSQIGAILNRSSFEGLIAKLKERLAENAPAPAAPKKAAGAGPKTGEGAP